RIASMKLPLFAKRPSLSRFLLGMSLHSFTRPLRAINARGPPVVAGWRQDEAVLRRTLKLTQHRLRAGRGIFARRLDIDLLDDAVVDDTRIALAPLTHAELRRVHGESHGVGELAIAVGQHGDVGGSLV